MQKQFHSTVPSYILSNVGDILLSI